VEVPVQPADDIEVTPHQALATMGLLADAAAGAMVAHHGATASTKDDGSPVTEVDVWVNDLVVDTVASLHPGCGVLGEERSANPHSRQLFVVDPVDGTAQFSCGPGVSTFVAAFVRDGEPLAALVHDPFTRRRFTAVRAQGAWCNEVPMRAPRAPRSLIVDLEGTSPAHWHPPGRSVFELLTGQALGHGLDDELHEVHGHLFGWGLTGALAPFALGSILHNQDVNSQVCFGQGE